MLKIRLVLLVVALCFLFAVLNSPAASVDMSAGVYDDNGDGNDTVFVTVVADEDILCIDWSIRSTDDTLYPDPKKPFLFEKSGMYGTRWVYESFSIPGHIKGTKYMIEAEAWFWDGTIAYRILLRMSFVSINRSSKPVLAV